MGCINGEEASPILASRRFLSVVYMPSSKPNTMVNAGGYNHAWNAVGEAASHFTPYDRSRSSSHTFEQYNKSARAWGP